MTPLNEKSKDWLQVVPLWIDYQACTDDPSQVYYGVFLRRN